ncbi:TRAP transporter substrate-binding protein DctP [Marivivens aquimaris]|uniref:TRAP transporter substrate-binding protein DctP n=1 Tax=Marivivens aquimaris TaxID=2774876 RepID=UPI00187E9B21|nr:TRAP transporter substrate-binding protein DctP [Marivivens aquimaris]MBN7787420.1 TRAP transporter substrate-binding protein DctP [Enemella evansiae]
MTRLWTALAASALALHTATPAFAEDITLRFAGVFPIDHQGTKMMEQVAAEVNAADVGLDMTVYPASQLGSGEALFEDVARGNIDFASAFIYSDTDSRLEFLNMPFLVSSYDDMERVLLDMDSDYNRILQDITDEYGVRVMAANPEGFVGIVATKAPDNWNTFDDKGMNIRVWSSNAVKSTVESLGYRATTMAWGDIFPALQSGIVDGAICCTKTATYSIFAKSDVGTHFVEYNALLEQTFYYGSERTLAKLNDEQRAVIQAAMNKASADFFAYNRENDAAFGQKLIDSGYTILKLNEEDQKAMTDYVRAEIWPTMEGAVGKDVIEKVLDAVQ